MHLLVIRMPSLALALGPVSGRPTQLLDALAWPQARQGLAATASQPKISSKHSIPETMGTLETAGSTFRLLDLDGNSPSPFDISVTQQRRSCILLRVSRRSLQPPQPPFSPPVRLPLCFDDRRRNPFLSVDPTSFGFHPPAPPSRQSESRCETEAVENQNAPPSLKLQTDLGVQPQHRRIFRDNLSAGRA
ncbi:hypothetical protein VTI74DRAFT_5036 [Chaetomium olivicolor]